MEIESASQDTCAGIRFAMKRQKGRHRRKMASKEICKVRRYSISIY